MDAGITIFYQKSLGELANKEGKILLVSFISFFSEKMSLVYVYCRSPGDLCVI